MLFRSLGDRFKPVGIFENVFKKGLLGKKSGKGYYIYGKERLVNPEVASLLTDTAPARFKADEYIDRLILIMINEAARCLEEKIVEEADAIDVGMIFGTGFPPFRGGLLRYADNRGIDNIVKSLEALAQNLNAERFKPCQYLLHLNDHNRTFYPV